MKVSLITACFNSAKTLRTAMDSVVEQRGVDVEYIIVDGGSSDGTVDIIKDFESKLSNSQTFKPSNLQTHQLTNFSFKWISEPDKGMYDAINKGIKMATGDVVGILNADDVLESPDTLAHICLKFGVRSSEFGIQDAANNSQLTTYNSQLPIEAVYADIRFVKDDLETTLRYYGAKHWKPWMLQWGKMPPHPSVYIRREIFEGLGYYKLGYKIAADYELLIRYFRKAKLKTSYLNESLVRMRMGGKSTRGWGSFMTLNKEIVRGNRENGYFCCFPMLLPKYLFKVFEFILPRLGRKAKND